MQGFIVILIVVPILTLFLVVLTYASRIKRIGPNQVMIISGQQSPPGEEAYRLVLGPGRAFIWPILEQVDCLSLEVIRTDFIVKNAPAIGGEKVTLAGVTQVKIDSDHLAIVRAARHFLSKSQPEVQLIVTDLIESHMRSALEKMSKNDVKNSPAAFSQQVEKMAAESLAEMGLVLVSCTVRKVS